MSWSNYSHGEQWRDSNNAMGLINQLSQRVRLLKKVSIYMPRKRFDIICQGLFYSKLVYCLQIIGNVWGMTTADEVNRRCSAFSKEDNRRLQTLQNQVLCLKTGLPARSSTNALLQASGDLSVQQLTALYTLTSCYKIIQTVQPTMLEIVANLPGKESF